MGLGRQVAKGLAWVEDRALVPLAVVGFMIVVAQVDLSDWAWPSQIVTGILSLLLIHRLYRAYRTIVRSSQLAPAAELPQPQLQLQLLLLCSIYLLVGLTGGSHSPVYPLLWAFLAMVGGLEASRRRVLLVIGAGMLIEILPWLQQLGTLGDAGWGGLVAAAGWVTAVHLSAIVFFPFLTRASIALLVQHHRLLANKDSRERKAQARLERREQERDAKRYRLEGGVAGIKAGVRSAEKRKRSSLDNLKQRVGGLLVIVDEALRPNTLAFFLLSKDGSQVELMECRSRCAEQLVRSPLPAGRGVIGAILKSAKTVSFNHVRWDNERFSFYSKRVGIKTFIGVPIFDPDEGHLRGVLLADRIADVPFNEDDEQLMLAAARELIHSMDTERALSSTEMLGGLFDASKQLSRAVNLAEVVDEVLVQVRNLLPGADLTAIALEEGGRTWLAGIQAAEDFTQFKKDNLQQVVDSDSLCCKAIETRTVLPSTPFSRRSKEKRQIFGRAMKLSGIESLKCFPLKVAGSAGRKSQPGEEHAIGAMVVAGRADDLFPEDPDELQSILELLEILANIGAISIQNAQRWEQLERLATTDGLTGLHNHRRFKEMLDEEVAASARYGRHLSMILSDIDHFKNVNDSYGHPMGDEVLKRVARVLSELAREADKVCRYGGEEFAIILPETDTTGANMLAERFREQIKAQSFTYEGKQFQVTLSLGICTLPDFARHRQELIDRADQALYHAKGNGRDRTVHFAEIASKAASGV